ncbi:MAG: hypothetical protein ACK5MI_09515 [Mangrovibacterium sp.]
MTQNKNNQGNMVAIVTMFFLFAMVGFVTNLAAPIGGVWKKDPLIGNSNFLGMLGNMMNFLAYLFFGIRAGKILTNKGYKATALIAIAVGFFGILTQFLSGSIGLGSEIAGLPVNFFVYLLGAFVSGISVCMLNTVVNPMLNLLGGSGNKGNQLVQTGGALNSLAATLSPMIVGALIGSSVTSIHAVYPVLYIAMGIFAAAFIALSFIPINEPESNKGVDTNTFEHSPWNFRHFVLGAIAIGMYVGIEIGIPGTLNFYLSDITGKGAGLDAATAAAVAGSVAGTYWFLMLIGRFIGSAIGGKVSSKTMLTVASIVGVVLITTAIFIPRTVEVLMPVFKGAGFGMVSVPMSALLLVLCGLCTSIMWGGIFNLAVEGLGKYTAMGSGIFMMMVVGGGIFPLFQNWVADVAGYMTSYWVIVALLLFLVYYALVGCKNVNKDIPVD